MDGNFFICFDFCNFILLCIVYPINKQNHPKKGGFRVCSSCNRKSWVLLNFYYSSGVAIMFKKAVYSFKKSSRIMGIILFVILGYSFYDSSIFNDYHFRMGFLAMLVGDFLYFFLWKNPRDKVSD